ncbi:hypothetical protein IVB36_28035 [Bradyrhizobium sp. 35]|uniref:hypothetical protein n=1 Tax=Bradyrhizobium sp. 35 TaxID=2782670 RepID=UPI001FF9D2C1|nr:hypothetical protein [Bradyrhizobium sp. 35]MCK1454609.1 hypothetical protein [Bradyrhizobium sp. 35]
MQTAREAKVAAAKFLASKGMLLSDIVEWEIYLDENDDDRGGSTVSAYFLWYGGSHLCCFDWPWESEAFDAKAYRRFFSAEARVSGQCPFTRGIPEVIGGGANRSD